MLFNRINPKSVSLFLVGFLVLLLVNVSFAWQDKAIKQFREEISANDIFHIDLETTNGGIEILGDEDAQTILIEAEMKVTGKKREICQKLLEKIEIEIEQDRKTVKIYADTPGKFGYSTVVSFALQVPSRMRVEAASTNGGIGIHSIYGGIEAETTNGSIDCSDVSGGLDLETTNGGINLDGIEGNLDANTTNGSIICNYKKSKPEKVHFESTNGRIQVWFKSFPDATIRAETVNGAIRIAGEKIKKTGLIGTEYKAALGNGKGDYSFETVNGSITIDMPIAE